jgi:hypothetical protein
MMAAQRHVGGREDALAEIVDRPADLTETSICALSGMRSGEACRSRRTEWLPPDASPLPCSWHHASETGLLTLWPDEYRHWASERGLLEDERPLADGVSRRVGAASARVVERRLSILSPADGAVYLLDPTLRPEFQALSLRAAGTRGILECRVDGRPVGSAPVDRRLSWVLRPGRHRIMSATRADVRLEQRFSSSNGSGDHEDVTGRSGSSGRPKCSLFLPSAS